MQASTVPQPAGGQSLPLACSLSGSELRERGDWLERLGRHVVRREPRPGGVIVRFRRDAGVEEELRELAAAEARCCPFLTLSLRAHGDLVELDVSGPPEAQSIVEEMFGASRDG
jgi:MerR family transcriptional regulator, copper efflux regulator